MTKLPSPPNLAGAMVALSVSDAADMGRLGYPQREVDRALFSICGALVRAGARLAYGGNLEPAGYTFKIFRFLATAYTDRGGDAPFIHFAPSSELRKVTLGNLAAALAEGSGIVEMRTVAADGRSFVVLLDDERPIARPVGGGDLASFSGEEDFQLWAAALAGGADAGVLSAMRVVVSDLCRARIAMGGKTGVLSRRSDQYSGRMPGVVEETIATLNAGCVPIVLGAFGGAARDIAIALGLLDEAERVPRGEQAPSYAPAIAQLVGLRDKIPQNLFAELKTIAAMDQTELLGHRIAALCAQVPARP